MRHGERHDRSLQAIEEAKREQRAFSISLPDLPHLVRNCLKNGKPHIAPIGGMWVLHWHDRARGRIRASRAPDLRIARSWARTTNASAADEA